MSEKSQNSAWTVFLDPTYKDPYGIYKDNISFQLETLILKVENEILELNKDYTKPAAREMAVCLVMEQMLSLQNQYASSSMNTMAISLFSELPGLKDFRMEILEKAKEIERKKSWIEKFFNH